MGPTERQELIKPEHRAPGHGTPGMVREDAIALDGFWAGFVKTDAGMTSSWHHHGDNESAIFVISGALRLEFGAGGKETFEAKPGDFI
jgi:uncharacterized RmlC-like cupin family protein